MGKLFHRLLLYLWSPAEVHMWNWPKAQRIFMPNHFLPKTDDAFLLRKKPFLTREKEKLLSFHPWIHVASLFWIPLGTYQTVKGRYLPLWPSDTKEVTTVLSAKSLWVHTQYKRANIWRGYLSLSWLIYSNDYFSQWKFEVYFHSRFLSSFQWLFFLLFIWFFLFLSPCQDTLYYWTFSQAIYWS